MPRGAAGIEWGLCRVKDTADGYYFRRCAGVLRLLRGLDVNEHAGTEKEIPCTAREGRE